MSADGRRRLPGTVAEIEASPCGPRTAAFFDLDGTLVAGFTALLLTQDRIWNRQIGIGQFVDMATAAVNHQLGRLEFERLVNKGAAMLRGMSAADLDELAERLFVEKIRSRIYPEMRLRVRAHQDRGHTVVLSSSALPIQVEPVARFLGIEHVLSNRFAVDEDGLLTGAVLQPILWGVGKARAAEQFAEDKGVDLARSYFYADGDEDVALMYLVGNPRPTNPESKLAAVAAKRGWPVQRFRSRSAGSPLPQLRMLAGVATMLPVAAGGLAWGLLNRDRRRGVNFFTANWPTALLALTGVDIDVIGRENLTVARPAVFLYNHRNNFDPFITGALLRDNWTSVGKKELEHDPIVGTIGKLVDAAFIDRDDSKSAVESLRKVEELAKDGISIMIAPEGTRTDTTGVGPFKKGPFRIAMSAGIPIVPVVIRNVEVIAAPDGRQMSPGTVEVAVLEPISVEDWTHDDLPERIEQVRQLYLDTLKDWPAGPRGRR